MADDVNAVALTGRLTADPELRPTQEGRSLLTFSLAVNHYKKGAPRDEEADFVRCLVWGPRADGLAGCLRKGSRVAVAGALRQHRWTGKDGGRRSELEVLCAQVVLCGPRPEGAAEPTAPAPAPAAPAAQAAPEGAKEYDARLQAAVDAAMQAPAATLYDDEIPF